MGSYTRRILAVLSIGLLASAFAFTAIAGAQEDYPPPSTEVFTVNLRAVSSSLKRAETARDYLVAKGIDAGRITVQSYSFDWARVEAEPGKSEGKNRRVQVLLR